MQDLFDINGSINGTTEPSLKELIFKYFNAHFLESESNTLTNIYIDSLIKHYNMENNDE